MENQSGWTFHDIAFGLGWSRFLPPSATLLLAAVGLDGPLHAYEPMAGDLRPDALAWEPLLGYTDEELTRVRVELADTAFAASLDEPTTASQVMAEEAAARLQDRDRLTRFAVSFGLQSTATIADIVRLMLAIGLLAQDETGAYRLGSRPPLPQEVLQLTSKEADYEDLARWTHVHAGTANSIIRLFHPDDTTRPTSITTTLTSLATKLGSNPESIRESIAINHRRRLQRRPANRHRSHSRNSAAHGGLERICARPHRDTIRPSGDPQ